MLRPGMDALRLGVGGAGVGPSLWVLPSITTGSVVLAGGSGDVKEGEVEGGTEGGEELEPALGPPQRKLHHWA